MNQLAGRLATAPVKCMSEEYAARFKSLYLQKERFSRFKAAKSAESRLSDSALHKGFGDLLAIEVGVGSIHGGREV